MKLSLPLVAAALSALLAPLAHAQQQVFTIAPDTSTVDFTLGGSAHATHGAFHLQKGAITFSRTAPAISGLVVVAAGSGKTGNDKRDEKMSTEVLDAPHFMEVTFVPKSYTGAIAPTGDSVIQVTGVFTLHGTPHDLTVPMKLHVDGAACTARTTFTVPYVQWGLKDPSIFILKVAKQVDIDLDLVGQLAEAPSH